MSLSEKLNKMPIEIKEKLLNDISILDVVIWLGHIPNNIADIRKHIFAEFTYCVPKPHVLIGDYMKPNDIIKTENIQFDYQDCLDLIMLLKERL